MKEIYIFDLDGTLANNDHRQHFLDGEKKQWDEFFEACDKDKPIIETIDVLRSLYYGGHKIYIFTGRSASVWEKTVGWLDDNKVPFHKIVMRPEEDYTPDEELKWGMVEEHIGDPNRIKAIFDDRNKVVEMWRNKGLTCYHVDHAEF